MMPPSWASVSISVEQTMGNQSRIQNRCSYGDIPTKTKAMHIYKRDCVSQIKEEKMANMGFQHSCPSCSRVFLLRMTWLFTNAAGATVEMLFVQGRVHRPINEHHQKRKSKEEDRPHVITLNNTQVENVYGFTSLDSCFQADGEDMTDIKYRINISQVVFNGLHHL